MQKKKAKKAIAVVSIFSIMLTGMCGCDLNQQKSSSVDESSETTEDAVANTPSKGFTYIELKSEADERSDNYMGFMRYEGGIVITGYVGSDTDIIIPEEIDGKPVVGINDFAFCPLRLTRYGKEDYDFYDDDLGKDFTSEDTQEVQNFIKNHEKYSNITSIKIPSSIVWYGDDPFFFCDSLETVEIYGDSNAVVYHAGKMFHYCFSLQEVRGTIRYLGLEHEIETMPLSDIWADHETESSDTDDTD